MRGKLMLVLLALLSTVLLAGCTQMSAEEMARNIEEKYNAVKDFKGILRVTAEGKSGKMVMEYEYVFKKPNKVRMHNKEMGTLIVSNGEKMWIYDEKKNEVFVMDVGQYNQVNPDYGELVKDMLKRYDVKILGSEKVSGRDCYVVQLTPKDNESIEAKMWVDKEYWYPLKIEHSIGGIKSTVEYINVEFNTGVSDDEFQFTPPEGAKIKTEEDLGIKKFNSVEEAQKHVDFRILKPAYTAGYELKEVSLMFNSVSLMYAKKDKMLMITEAKGEELPKMQNAENVKVEDSEGLYAEIYGSSMLMFKKGDVVVTMTGMISKEELIKIAESMG
ncbi:Outer membrane lipoprotein-sorting protein [Archaeoglobus sulfaticallidus PM70-1]|uniref:Outer membrane lipoprotein-sorting protein n=1 Tax=Archaeoglobus sulfaticallidus PM70-1 TaxID=387631 RepID=N0BN42_9EURY|nr:outer membrane lipoprotein-sorting protein [Archaeoglobus sulfaticallidus]AGK62016.1 Outer membrane lipoprotein-sorting protein [Archaeoglobus sulfaticallidus PM70-1]